MKKLEIVILAAIFMLSGCTNAVSSHISDNSASSSYEETTEITSAIEITSQTTQTTDPPSLTTSSLYTVQHSDTEPSTQTQAPIEQTNDVSMTTDEVTEPVITETSTQPQISTEYVTENTSAAAITATSSSSAVQAEPKTPSYAVVLKPKASGVKLETNSKAEIDYSDTSDGYMMCRYFGEMSVSKILVDTPTGITYTYDLNVNGDFEVFTFTEGSGTYTIKIAEKVSDKYATAMALSIDVKLSDELTPFLLPNQYINFNSSSKAVTLGEKLCSGTKTALEKVEAVYCWIVENVTYDKELAASIGKNYIPTVDKAVTHKKGVCSEYAAALTAMLRSQQIPTKLVVGYSGTIYHAWISVYTKETGWIEKIIYFDGIGWHRLDPTFAASNNSSQRIIDYIETDTNYTEKFIY